MAGRPGPSPGKGVPGRVAPERWGRSLLASGQMNRRVAGVRNDPQGCPAWAAGWSVALVTEMRTVRDALAGR